MIYPNKEEFLKKSKEGNVVPVYRELLADMETPVSAYVKLGQGQDYGFLLESVEGGEKIGRYSFLGADPAITFSSTGRRIKIEENNQEKVFDCKGDPLDELRKIINCYSLVEDENLPRFCGGAVGYIGYDVVRYFERLPDTAKDELSVPETFFMIADTLLVFDRISHTVKVVSNAFIKDDPLEAYQQAIEKIDNIVLRLKEPAVLPSMEAKTEHRKLDIKSNMSKEKFESMVEKAKEYIFDGDVIQVVLSQRFEADINASPFSVYRSLRSVNPSPYMFFLKFGEVSLAGASPEIMVRCEDGRIEVRPIAGTRPRGKNPQEDLELEKELLADPKERAEHIMLVDLGRNDVGRVSRFGTIEIPEKMVIEKYSHVMHIVTSVIGHIKEGCDQFDVLRAAFPAGTVSGSPKIRAMEIIEELEDTRRGPYAGAVTYFGFTGNLDSCITIRTVLMKGGKAYIQAGAGIVADSDPATEHQETLNKAEAMMEALVMAEAFKDTNEN
ncbi:MAG: anthranilate synthase component I [Candidatus Theseobacter exili]|nr:anthranilate synthase component I [Candidatus Theseobacter exili]